MLHVTSQDRPKREVRAGLKTEKKKKRPTAVAAAEPEEIMAKPVNERELLEMMRRPAHSDQVRSLCFHLLNRFILLQN